jgi:hypothetical protein
MLLRIVKPANKTFDQTGSDCPEFQLGQMTPKRYSIYNSWPYHQPGNFAGWHPASIDRSPHVIHPRRD